MFTYLGAALSWLVNYFIMTPGRWFLALDFYDWQLPVYIFGGFFLFARPLTVTIIDSVHNFSEGRKDNQHKREWKQACRLDATAQAEVFEDMRDRQQDLIQQAQSLEEQAYENKFWFIFNSQRNMFAVAQTKHEKAHEVGKEIERLQRLFQRVAVEKSKLKNDVFRIFGLLSRIGSENTSDAQEALKDLNKVRNGEWIIALADKVPINDRILFINCLRQVSGSTNLNEARVALSRILKIMKSHNLRWEDLAK
jgi:hypothetical protein